eukprot:3631128-Ditylum_brightwellii.AAC.1
MVRRGNSVGLQCFRPDCDEVLNAIASDHCNVIYLESDIELAPGPVDDTIISASTGVPTWGQLQNVVIQPFGVMQTLTILPLLNCPPP